MVLPPLADLFAFSHRDPAAVAAAAASLRGEFDEVWQPAPGWVAAAAPLPGGEPDGAIARQHGLAFAEGRQAILAAEQPAAGLARVAELASTRPEALGSLPGDFGFIHFQPGG